MSEGDTQGQDARRSMPPIQATLIVTEETRGPVTCLGLSFASDAERRAYFTDRLREHLTDPAFRAQEGFPVGSDEDILALSDPPYYTACPNPFLEDFIRCHRKPYEPGVPYRREPLAVDASEGKTDPLYTAHSYHTKVPHKAIMRYILHYTEPGDVVLDGFAGSGMTGVAAQMCGSPESAFKLAVERERKAMGLAAPQWGARRVVLNDLGPAATFIGANYNLPVDVAAFEREATRVLAELQSEVDWMYTTRHSDGVTTGRINYTVWSQVFNCPACGKEIVFLKAAFDPVTKQVRESFPCPGCAATQTKDTLDRVTETLIDPVTHESWQRVRFIPVFLNYSIRGVKYEKEVDEEDLLLLDRIAALPYPVSSPTVAFPITKMSHGSRLAPKGFTSVYHLYLPRAM
jgi:hypothetical protein